MLVHLRLDQLKSSKAKNDGKNAKHAANEYTTDELTLQLYKLVSNFVPDFFFRT